ncbi:hypothetical protein VP01_1633g5 [Puccinia sorghi]|uniref:Uncharacterized protein n=1 Tax=Puccinia sorghi TaxID=27349 RepID=A0A0L6VIN8_9BASI|nr:hypothetical protein VP01_1633g5 [Puccinia sorghi]
MPNKWSKSAKSADKSAEFSIVETPVLLKFLLNPNSYVSYINPQLILDGSNITQCINSLNNLACLLFSIKNFVDNEDNFYSLD